MYAILLTDMHAHPDSCPACHSFSRQSWKVPRMGTMTCARRRRPSPTMTRSRRKRSATAAARRHAATTSAATTPTCGCARAPTRPAPAATAMTRIPFTRRRCAMPAARRTARGTSRARHTRCTSAPRLARSLAYATCANRRALSPAAMAAASPSSLLVRPLIVIMAGWVAAGCPTGAVVPTPRPWQEVDWLQ